MFGHLEFQRRRLGRSATRSSSLTCPSVARGTECRANRSHPGAAFRGFVLHFEPFCVWLPCVASMAERRATKRQARTLMVDGRTCEFCRIGCQAVIAASTQPRVYSDFVFQSSGHDFSCHGSPSPLSGSCKCTPAVLAQGLFQAPMPWRDQLFWLGARIAGCSLSA